MEEMVTVSVRLPRSMIKEIEELARERGVDRSTVVRELVARGLREAKLKRALELIREGKLSVWRGAEEAGVSYREMLELLKKHNIPYPLSLDEVLRELDEIESSE